MRFSLALLIVIVLMSCGGNLSDEQRRKLSDRAKSEEIKRVTEGELMSAAFTYGRSIADVLTKRDPSLANKELIDSLERAFNVNITAIKPGDSLLLGVEQKLIEAYTSSAGQVDLPDDVQKMEKTDSILYTKPLLRERPDGSVEFTRALSIHMPTRSVVLSIKE
ncbi:MAG TPA: hypothetical protein VFE50_06565 [Cyclobacteriaceae bacterium]|nr:hypothetical protein [Cyclobacteriaceae bacterium]